MTASRDIDRLISTFLEDGATVLPDRAYDVVRSEIDRTRQRVVIGPWRTPDMNTVAKLALAAAAVVVVAVVGINLLPRSGGDVGVAQPSASPSPTPAPSASPSATPIAGRAVPPAGPLEMGKRYPFELEGVAFTLAVPTADWVSNGEFGIDKSAGIGPDGAGFIFWRYDANGVYSDPCAKVKARPVGPKAADIADAITEIPGTDLVSGPTALTVGGKPAQMVAIRIRDDISCTPESFHLWYDTDHEDQSRYASRKGSTIRVWITEVNGKRVQIDGETYQGAGSAPGQELQAIIDSIKFE